LAWLAGCTASDPGFVTATPLDEALVMTEKAEPKTYLIAPGDDITVRFYYNPQLDEDLRVRPDGKIALSLIGEVPAAGKTAEQLSKDVTEAYSKYLVKSTAVVLVRAFANSRAFIAGEVRNPGLLDLQRGSQTLTQSIASSGGPTDAASLTDVILVRRLPNSPEPVIMELNVTRVLNGREPQLDVMLQPNDLVYVPRSGIASVNLAIRQYIFNNFNASMAFSAATTVTP
jgi:protein involved in polysaccharide export with SLBB domain